VRHGTASLLAALDVHRGGVLQAADLDRNTAANFTCFLDELDTRVPADLEVHLVLEGGSSPIADATRWWFVDHPRFHAHDTPTHAWWLNQVEFVLLDPGPSAAQAGRVRLGRRFGGQGDGVHRRRQPHRHAVPLDL
jgi:hypothetical protein